MAKNIRLTNREIQLVNQVVLEYLQIFGEAEGTRDYTEYMLDTGLGSAMKKILKYRNGQIQYGEYKSFRENYEYPTFEKWLEERTDNESKDDE